MAQKYHQQWGFRCTEFVRLGDNFLLNQIVKKQEKCILYCTQ